MAKILIKRGRVFDGEKFFEADVLTEGKTISKIAPGITDDADYTFTAEGMTVTAGLVDAHVHLAGISSVQYGIAADLCSLPFGVTAVADASFVHGDAATLNAFSVKSVGFVVASVKDNTAHFEWTLKMLKKFGDKTVGVKLYFDTTGAEVRDISPLVQTVEFAEKNGLRVMVHSSNSPVSMAELLENLRPGDILTHAYHGGVNNVSDDGYECVKRAKSRGVIIDAGLAGTVHMDFAVFKGAIECGAIPDIISTDITKCSAYKRGGRYGLPMCMSIARHLGMNETDIFRAVTVNPADALGKSDWGRLSEGGAADIAVLKWSDEGFDMTDKAGNQIKSAEGYRNMLTVADGEIVYRH